ncbi:MAG: nitrous oxide reductase accessory protein NosL [Cyclobacteriaceae bacterium]
MKNLWLIASSLIIASCAIEPEPIVYGTDACHFCKMTIVDNQHAGQLVTTKGRSYKYDAIECMMNHLYEWDKPEVAMYLVADYKNPGKLVDATSASYLITESIPSPMGEYLTAFGNSQNRDYTQTQQGGLKLDWTSLQNEFSSR